MLENVRFSLNSTMPLFFMLLGYVLYQQKVLSAMHSWPGPTSLCSMWRCRCSCSATWPPPMCARPLTGLCAVLLRGHTGQHPGHLGVGEAVFAGQAPCGRIRAGVLPLVGSHSGNSLSAEHLRQCRHVQYDDPGQRAALQRDGGGHFDAGRPTAAAQAGNMAAKLKKSVKGILTNPTSCWALPPGLPGACWASMPTMLDKALSSIARSDQALALLAIGAGVQGPQALGYLKPHRRGNCGQVDGAACAVPAGGGASWLYGRKNWWPCW